MFVFTHRFKKCIWERQKVKSNTKLSKKKIVFLKTLDYFICLLFELLFKFMWFFFYLLLDIEVDRKCSGVKNSMYFNSVNFHDSLHNWHVLMTKYILFDIFVLWNNCRALMSWWQLSLRSICIYTIFFFANNVTNFSKLSGIIPRQTTCYTHIFYNNNSMAIFMKLWWRKNEKVIYIL